MIQIEVILSKDQKTFQRNADRILKAWKKYAEEIGIDTNLWTYNIHMTPPVMMEGTSPKRLRGIFTHKNSGKEIIFSLGVYNGKYEVSKVKG